MLLASTAPLFVACVYSLTFSFLCSFMYDRYLFLMYIGSSIPSASCFCIAVYPFSAPLPSPIFLGFMYDTGLSYTAILPLVPFFLVSVYPFLLHLGFCRLPLLPGFMHPSVRMSLFYFDLFHVRYHFNPVIGSGIIPLLLHLNSCPLPLTPFGLRYDTPVWLFFCIQC